MDRYLNSSESYAKQLQMLDAAMTADPYRSKSIYLESRNGGGRGNEPSMYDKKNDAMRKRSELWDIFDGFIHEYAPIFRPHVEVEIENNDFNNGIQWDSTDIARFRKAKLPPHQSNRMTRWARTIMGEQRSTETIWNPVGLDNDSHRYAGLLGHIMNVLSVQNEFSDEEAMVWYDNIIGGRGYGCVFPDPADRRGNIIMQRCRPAEFMYDIYSAKNGALDECCYLLRAYYKDLEDLIVQYPAWEPELRNYGPGDFGTTHNLEFMTFQPRIPSVLKYRDLQRARFFQHGMGRGRKRAWVGEFYVRRSRPTIMVYDGFANVEHHFDNTPQAIYFYKNLSAAYQAAFLSQGQQPRPVVDPPEAAAQKVVDRYIWAGNNLLEVSTSETDRFPYEQLCSSYRDGEWRGFFEDDKDHQKIINRMMIWLEVLLSHAPGKNVINMHRMPEGTELEDVQEIMSHPTQDLIIDDADEKAVESVMRHYGTGDQGTTYKEILEFAKEGSNFVNGGLNQIGQPAFAGQSGRSIDRLSRAGMTATVTEFAALERWQRGMGQRVAYGVQFLSPNRIFAAIDKADVPTYMSVAGQQIQSIRGMQFRITISEKVKSLSERDRRHDDMMALMQQLGDYAKYVLPEALESMDAEQSIIDRVEARMKADQDSEAQQQQMQEARANMELAHKQRLAEEKVAIDAQRAHNEAHPAPKLSVTAKESLGPTAMGELMNEIWEIPADGAGIAKSQAQGALMDQDKADMAQQHWIENLPAPMKEKFLNSSESVPAAPPTAKSRISRMNKKQEA